MKKILLGLIFLLVSCVTGDANLNEVNFSLGEIKQVIKSVMGDSGSTSQNQRVYFSQYFGPMTDKKFDANKSKKRLYAKIAILGDQRPYDIAVDVIIEQKEDGQFEETGSDPKKAAQIAKEIQDRLHKGIENRNVIDDFRAF